MTEERVYEVLIKYLYGDNIDNLKKETLNKIKMFITNNKAIDFVLPSFPGKSPNRNSSFNGKFGYEERYSISVIEKMLTEIKNIYFLGARIFIIHDGHLFTDLGITRTDKELDNYIKEFRKSICEEIISVSLKDLMECSCYDEARKNINELYTSFLDIKDLNGELVEKELLFTKIEFKHQISDNNMSNNHLQMIAKKIAKESLLRKQALAECIEDKYPEAIRLSIHYQDKYSKKLGIRLIDKAINFGSPWFNIIYKCNDGKIILGKKDWFKYQRHLVKDDNGLYYTINQKAEQDFCSNRVNKIIKKEMSIGR